MPLRRDSRRQYLLSLLCTLKCAPCLTHCLRLAASLGVDTSSRILAFKQKAPAPDEGHDGGGGMRGLYSENVGQAPSKKQFRHVPQSQDRILDAPDLVDDYYLNLLDWNAQNMVGEQSA